jgi:hypothetical protein
LSPAKRLAAFIAMCLTGWQAGLGEGRGSHQTNGIQMKTHFSWTKAILFAGLLPIFAAAAGLSQTVNQITNYIVSTPGSQFKFDVNGQDSGNAQGEFVHNSFDFSLNAGATYIFNMNTTAGFHPVDICTNADTVSHFVGASLQAASGGTIVTLTIPATNFPTNLFYICNFHQFFGIITVKPPQPPPSATIIKTLVSTNVVLTFTGGTNTIPIVPQFSSNIAANVWLPVPGYTNTFTVSGTNTISFGRLEPICGPNVFLRISQAPN